MFPLNFFNVKQIENQKQRLLELQNELQDIDEVQILSFRHKWLLVDIQKQLTFKFWITKHRCRWSRVRSIFKDRKERL